MSHHPSLAPSSIPAIMCCACFQSCGDGDRDAGVGGEIHRIEAALSAGIDVDQEETTLDADLLESCKTTNAEALAFIKDNCPGSEIEIEKGLELRDNTGRIITHGTSDIAARNDKERFVLILDWKGCLDFEPDTKDYKEQTMTYALMKMRETGYERALCIEAFVTVKKLRPYWVTYAECTAVIECAMARRADPNKTPQANDYCKWCMHLLDCPAVNKRIGTITTLFCDMPKPEKFLDPSKMTPEEMAVALTFTRATLKQYFKKLTAVSDWIEAAAMKMSDENKEIPGYVRMIESGKKSVSDIDKAFRLSGMQAKDFFSSLKLSLPKLAETFAKVSGLKKGDARKEIEGRLNEVIVVGEAKAVLERAGAINEPQ